MEDFQFVLQKHNIVSLLIPKLKGAPSGHTLSIREVRLSSGAEFVVVVCGSIMTMPGLPRNPAADNIKLNKKGEIEGLF